MEDNALPVFLTFDMIMNAQRDAAAGAPIMSFGIPSTMLGQRAPSSLATAVAAAHARPVLQSTGGVGSTTAPSAAMLEPPRTIDVLHDNQVTRVLVVRNVHMRLACVDGREMFGAYGLFVKNSAIDEPTFHAEHHVRRPGGLGVLEVSTGGGYGSSSNNNSSAQHVDDATATTSLSARLLDLVNGATPLDCTYLANGAMQGFRRVNTAALQLQHIIVQGSGVSEFCVAPLSVQQVTSPLLNERMASLNSSIQFGQALDIHAAPFRLELSERAAVRAIPSGLGASLQIVMRHSDCLVSGRWAGSQQPALVTELDLSACTQGGRIQHMVVQRRLILPAVANDALVAHVFYLRGASVEGARDARVREYDTNGAAALAAAQPSPRNRRRPHSAVHDMRFSPLVVPPRHDDYDEEANGARPTRQRRLVHRSHIDDPDSQLTRDELTSVQMARAAEINPAVASAARQYASAASLHIVRRPNGMFEILAARQLTLDNDDDVTTTTPVSGERFSDVELRFFADSMTDDEIPAPHRVFEQRMADRVKHLLLLHKVKGFLRADQVDIAAFAHSDKCAALIARWPTRGAPRTVGRVVDNCVRTLRDCRLQVRSASEPPCVQTLPDNDPALCFLCCDNRAVFAVCKRCVNSICCEQCLDGSILAGCETCPACRGPLTQPAPQQQQQQQQPSA